MADRIIPGAYVIRNRKTSTVLHVESPDITNNWNHLLAFEQDENQYRDQQIWWIEPLTDLENDDGMEYSIISPAGIGCKTIDLNPEDPQGDGNKSVTCVDRRPLMIGLENGAPWQKWRLQRVREHQDGVYYNIVSIFNDYMISVGKTPDGKCYMESGSEEPPDECCWEFMIPMVAFPPGWFQLQNIRTGNLLNHHSMSSSPVLLPPPDHEQPSENRESWQAQWTLIHAPSSFPRVTFTTGKNTWCIKNRLTGGFLGNTLVVRNGITKYSVTAWERWVYPVDGLTWKLQMDADCNWKIIHYKTSFILDQGEKPLGGGTEIVCNDTKFVLGENSKRWTFRPPGLASGTDIRKPDEPPPDYNK